MSSSWELPCESVAVVLGTRPEIIKLAPLIKSLGPAAHVVHTGQHYDKLLNEVFLKGLGIGAPDCKLNVGGQTRGLQIGQSVSTLSEYFMSAGFRAAVVQGDTNSTLGGALAANASRLALFHVESGLRSFDRGMPEEHNRVLTDHLADCCLAPTELNAQNMLDENIPEGRIRVTGNTVVEALTSVWPKADEIESVLGEAGLVRGEYVLATLHRPENVDEPEALKRVFDALWRCSFPVYMPLHPRGRRRLSDTARDLDYSRCRVVEAVDYRKFLCLLSGAAFIVSDSGGVQEEVTVLKKRMVVVRRSTERPESLEDFCVRVGPNEDLEAALEAECMNTETRAKGLEAVESPFGDGKAAQRCMEELVTRVG